MYYACISCLGSFSLAHFSFLSLSLCLGDGSIETEILSERVIKPKTPNKLYRRVYRTLGYDKLTPVELEPSINI